MIPPALAQPAAVPVQIVQPGPSAPALSDAPARDELDLQIEFWSRQFSEHALFLSLGIVADPRLAKEAARQQGLWEAFRASGLSSGAAKDRFIELSTQLATLKGDVLARLEGGEWLGWLFPSFVRHILSELLWFTSRLEAKAPPAYGMPDVRSWLRLMAEHAAFAAHLLDPVEVKLIREARTLLGALQGLGSCGSTLPTLVDLSERAGRQLDQYLVASGIGTPKVKSVIHPVLAAHVVREGRMFLEILARTRTQGA